MYKDLLPALAEAGYRAVAPDLPGSGDSAPDRPAAPLERDTLRNLVGRALKHEPVQYLVGEAWFLPKGGTAPRLHGHSRPRLARLFSANRRGAATSGGTTAAAARRARTR